MRNIANLTRITPADPRPSGKGQPMPGRDDDRIVACLEDEHANDETERRDEDTRKERRPESRYLEPGHRRRDHQHHQRIDHQQKESEGDDRQRNGQKDDDRPDERVGQTQQECCHAQRAVVGELEAVEDEAGHP